MPEENSGASRAEKSDNTIVYEGLDQTDPKHLRLVLYIQYNGEELFLKECDNDRDLLYPILNEQETADIRDTSETKCGRSIPKSLLDPIFDELRSTGHIRASSLKAALYRELKHEVKDHINHNGDNSSTNGQQTQ